MVKQNPIVKSNIAGLLKKHESAILNKELSGLYADIQKTGFSLHNHIELAAMFHELNLLQTKEYDIVRAKTGKSAIDQHELITELIPELIVREAILRNIDSEHAKFIRNYLHESERAYAKALTGKALALHENPEAHHEAKKTLHELKINDLNKYLKVKELMIQKREQLIKEFLKKYNKEKMKELVADLQTHVTEHRIVDELLEHKHSAALAIDVSNNIEHNLDKFERRVVNELKAHI